MKRFFLLSVFLLSISVSGNSRPLFIAHRGANLEADENTLTAFEIAVRLGVDYIETDPRLTKDGFYVVHHDPTVDRMTDGKGKISEMTLKEVQALRTKNGEKIPTLDEVFRFALENNIGVYLDTKEKWLPAIQKLVEQIKTSEMSDRVILGLWKQDHLKWVEEHHPEINTCISWPWPPVSLRNLKKLNADWVGTLVPFATQTMIQKAHKQGLKVITLEINDSQTILKKINAGIDAILTDNPKLLPYQEKENDE